MYYPEDNAYLPDPYIDVPAYGQTATVTAHFPGSPGWLAQKAAEIPQDRLQIEGTDAQGGHRKVVTVSAPGAVGIAAEQWNSPSKVGSTWMGDPIPSIRKIQPGVWQFYTNDRRRDIGPEGGVGPSTVPIGVAFLTVTAYYADGSAKTTPNRPMNAGDCSKATAFCERVGLRIEDGAIRPRIVGRDILPTSPWVITAPPAGTSVILPGRNYPTIKSPGSGGSTPTNGNGNGTGNGTVTNGNGNGVEEPTWWDELPLAAKATGGAALGVGGAWLLFKLFRR